jgi:BCD family chlorophyll transporter-like MFS transporter
VVQATAVITVVLNVTALWKQERVKPMTKAQRDAEHTPTFREAWSDYAAGGTAGRLLVVVFLGTMAFNMQDVLLEPYGGEILGLSVSSTTVLTATWAAGALMGFALAAKWLAAGLNPYRMGARGILAGVAAFSAVIFSNPWDSAPLFFLGAGLIGFGGGLFAVSTLTAAMTMPAGKAGRGLAIGAWGAAQATAAGLSTAIGGGLRDVVNSAATQGNLGVALNDPATGYSVVYHIEILLLFVTLVALGPLVRTVTTNREGGAGKFGLADLPT